MKTIRSCFAALAMTASLSPVLVSGSAQALEVVATIKPLHAIVSAVMGKTGTPHLLVKSGSPHFYTLKPSDAGALQKADVIFLIDEHLETFISGKLKAMAPKATVHAMFDAPGMTHLEKRKGGHFEAHKHDDHDGHDDHDKHGHAKKGKKKAHDKHDDDHDHDHKKGHKKAHDDHDKHDHDKHAHDKKAEHADKHDLKNHPDMHIWLDPRNGQAMITSVVKALSAADPANAAAYKANGEAYRARLAKLEKELIADLKPHASKPFIVFHDAYQYLENRIGLKASGAVTLNPEVQPGAKRVREIQNLLNEVKAACIFSEPQFKPQMIKVIIEGTKTHVGQLDPIGAALPAGADLYPALLRANGKALADCFKKAGS